MARAIRANPSTFETVRSIERSARCSSAELRTLFAIHFHTTPQRFLEQSRLALARRLLGNSKKPEAEIATSVGFRQADDLVNAFTRSCGITPAVYRSLRPGRPFLLPFPTGYPVAYGRRALSRDPHTLSERWRGETFEAAVSDRFGEATLSLHFSGEGVQARVSQGSAEAIHRRVTSVLGIGQDTQGFVRVAKGLGLTRLVRGRESLPIVQTLSVFEGLTWSILGQQISFSFACMLKSRLARLAGKPLEGGLIAPPTAIQVAALSPKDLLPLQFSRQKADYLLTLAKAIVEGEFPAEDLAEMSAARAERILLSARGIGPWSANYVMMRSLGLHDCLPLGDTGVTSALQAFFKLTERPGKKETLALMAPFSPYRSLATTHLWNFQSPIEGD